MARLTNKIALVTGAAGGIGQGIARAMAAEGATLILADIKLEGLQSVAQEIGGEAVPLDVTSEQAWSDVARQIEERHRRLDILINNAGLVVVKPLEKMSAQEIRLQFAVNLEGPLLGCKALLPLLRSAGSPEAPASVINIASVAGLIGLGDEVAYSVSKAGVGHMARALAVEWAQHGFSIRVNAIFPGCIRTSMLEAAVEGFVREGIMPAETAWQGMRDYSVLGQIGEVSDIAMGAVYLASDEAKFVTGTSLVIDGGWVAK
ncbi:SDR family oxidoreductase [Sphingobium phenoxybenzoativorans]|uniref:SDR family oxidoreductase n=1 Tax=Sphingobium phenoxybenzoativorans TaxID=1592790 RepID=A0A975K8R6_9SPHN|nr:SDR family oxidoreductase [Sphingobium phenoxybenzoativorans]QUT06845.1 SDR family oxidoreductase [Sphingobium phenoxybenzoativorans]